MPRVARLDAPGLVQHVIARGIEHRNIFVDDADRHFFIERLSTILTDASSPCYAWVLMSNHFHLLLRTANYPLSKIMRRLLGGYATYFNLRHRRSGHLFQNRYKSIVVEEDSYLAMLVSYIHLNPIRAGLVEDIKRLGKYQWSGHLALVGKTNYMWQDTKFVLGFFGNRKAYLENLAARANEDITDLDGGGLHRSLLLKKGQRPSKGESGSLDYRVLGSAEYTNLLLEKIETPLLKPTVDARQKLLQSICQYFDITSTELKGNSRERKISQARAVFATIAANLGLSGADIARELVITEPAVIKAIARGRLLLNSLPNLRNQLVTS